MMYPSIYVDNVKEIKVEYLKQNNIQALILDVDNTLIDIKKIRIEGLLDWVNSLKSEGIKFCIVSNSNDVKKVKELAEEIDMPYIFFAKKPLKFGFLKAKKILEIENESIAVVGDQLFTDILGANRCKMKSILVNPIKENEYLITKIKRPIERAIIKKYQKSLEN